MSDRILGRTGSPRRRRFLLGPMFVAVLLAVFVIPSAQAVHELGLFELEGNATDDPCAVAGCLTTPPASYTTAKDAENVFNGTSNGLAPLFIGQAVEHPSVDTSYFTGGGSKDVREISQWAHSATDKAPDKDDLTDVFAVAYVNPADNHVVLYFGTDRFDTSGSSQLGFWFFKNQIGVVNPGGSGGFSGTHAGTLAQPGDVLVLSDFTTGGKISNIRVFKWVGSGGDTGGTLQSVAIGGDCKDLPFPPAVVPPHTACGTVNPPTAPSVAGNTVSPWTYSPKGTLFGSDNDFAAGAYYEGGIDLTAELGSAVGCFSSFLTESRSSGSAETAQLKDFALGPFNTCQATTQTVPGQIINGNFTPVNTINIGDSIRDRATVTGSAAIGNAPAPTGSVHFFVCGPLSSATGCASGGTDLGSVTLTPGSGSSSTAISASFTPNAAGIWCFRGEYTPDAGSPYQPSQDASANECFTVNPRQPAIITNATAGPVPIGTAISDTATLSNTANRPDGSPAGGTIVFTAYGPNDATCSTAVFTSSPVPVSGNGTYGPVSFTPAAAGTYRWIAVYSGDPPNTLGASTSCNDANEASVVSPRQPNLITNATAGPVTIGTAISDTATLSNTANRPDGSPAGGTIVFTAYGPNDPTCTNIAFTSSPVAVSGNGTYGPVSFTPAAAGTYQWIAVYSGDPPNTLGVQTSCLDANEASVVAPKQPSLLTNATPSVALGSPISDTATLSNTANQPNGSPAGGTIVFTAYGPDDSTCTGAAAFTATVSVSGDGTYGPVSFTPTVAGTYRWIAVYSGDPPNTLGVSTSCNDANETSVVISLQPAIATSQSFVPNDSATITVASGGGDLAGSVRFRLYETADCSGNTLIDETKQISGPSPQTASTSNTTPITTTKTTLSWLVEYTSNNPAHTNVISSCATENSSLTINNG